MGQWLGLLGQPTDNRALVSPSAKAQRSKRIASSVGQAVQQRRSLVDVVNVGAHGRNHGGQPCRLGQVGDDLAPLHPAAK